MKKNCQVEIGKVIEFYQVEMSLSEVELQPVLS